MADTIGHIVNHAYKTNYKSIVNGDCKVMGKNVIVRLVVDEKREKQGNIFIPQNFVSKGVNCETVKGEIVDFTNETMMEYGLEKGMIILFDRYAAYGHPPMEPGICVVLEAENLIGVV